jgi:hypothetical protein
MPASIRTRERFRSSRAKSADAGLRKMFRAENTLEYYEREPK